MSNRPSFFTPRTGYRPRVYSLGSQGPPCLPFGAKRGEVTLFYRQFKDFILQRICGEQYQKFIERCHYGEIWYLLGDNGISEFITDYLSNNVRSSIRNGRGERLFGADLRRLCIWLLHGADIMGYYRWAPMSHLFQSTLLPLEVELAKQIQSGTRNSFRVWHAPRTGMMAVRCIAKPFAEPTQPQQSVQLTEYMSYPVFNTELPDLSRLEPFK